MASAISATKKIMRNPLLRSSTFTLTHSMCNTTTEAAMASKNEVDYGKSFPLISPYTFDLSLSSIDALVKTKMKMNEMLDAGKKAVKRSEKGGMRKCWRLVGDDNNFYLIIDMPGVDMDNVKVIIEKDEKEQVVFIIQGKECYGDGDGDDNEGTVYSTRLGFEGAIFEVNKITWEMKNGELNIVLPKLKPVAN